MKIQIRSVPVEQINPAAYNPRKKLKPGDAEYEKLEQSLDVFGYVDPIVWNERTGNMVGGHQRYTVLVNRGETELDVSVVNLSLSEEKALNIALNKISGEWDDEKLAALLQELADDADIDELLTGFEMDEIEEIIASVANEAATEGGAGDEDETASEALDEAPETPVTIPGAIYVLDGRHRVMCGDATKSRDVARLMDGETARLCLTDPPYNVDYEGEAGKIANDNMPDSAFRELLRKAFANMYEYSAPGAAAYVFHADTEGMNFRGAFGEAGYKLRECLVWVKDTFVLGRQDYHWQHEPILYGWRDGAAHYFVPERTHTTVLSCPKPARSEEHPTMKPIPLLSELIQNSSKRGWSVLDLFGGAGSTLIACEQTGRVGYLMELDPHYCDVIVLRWIKWRKAQGLPAKVEVIEGGERSPCPFDA